MILAKVCLIYLVFIPAAAIAKPSGHQAPGQASLRACPWTPPEAEAFDTPQSQLDAENKADEGDDSEDENSGSATNSDASAGSGFYIPGSGCVLIGGSLTSGPEFTEITSKGSRLIKPGRISNLQFALTAGMDFTHYTQTEYGELITRLGFEGDQNKNVSITSASVSLGSATFGLETSFYDGWQASEFSFRALTPTQSPAQMAYVFRPTTNSTLTFALEDPSYRRATVSGYGGLEVPDLIGRYRYSAGDWQFIGSAATHETTFSNATLAPFSPQPAPVWGFAMQGYARYALPNDAQEENSYIILQAGYAHHAPGYLGINNPTSAFNLALPGAFGAENAERATGMNGAMVVSWAWSEKWSSAAFISATKLDLPDNYSSGSVLSGRSALNLTYTPVENLNLTIEGGFARVISHNSSLPSSRQTSLIFSVSHSFP